MKDSRNSNKNRLSRVENDIAQLKADRDRIDRQIAEHIDGHIVEDLQTERFHGSGKPLYTYEEIANRHNVAKSKVQRIAEKEGLTRRNIKSVK